MCMAKEPYVYGKRALCVWQKSPMCMAKEPYVYCKRALLATIMDDGEPPPCGPTAQDALCLAERDLLTIQKRPTYHTKEIYLPYKRDLLTQHKTRSALPKETFLPYKRDLLAMQNRPTNTHLLPLPTAPQNHTHYILSKETYLPYKTDLRTHTCCLYRRPRRTIRTTSCQKRPTYHTKETY
jgi:hypothetical protein